MEPTLDSIDASYMALLTRHIPGVGTNSNSSQQHPPSAASATAHFMSPLTDKQKDAIRILDGAHKDALFVSEGEEPFQTVHIAPKRSIAQDTPTAAATDNAASQQPLPSETEFIRLLQEAQLIPYDDGDDHETFKVICERTKDLSSILNEFNTGRGNISKALHDLFGYDATFEANNSVALYRVTLPSSTTRVHLWVLGWVDHHLLGLHTISIES